MSIRTCILVIFRNKIVHRHVLEADRHFVFFGFVGCRPVVELENSREGVGRYVNETNNRFRARSLQCGRAEFGFNLPSGLVHDRQTRNYVNSVCILSLILKRDVSTGRNYRVPRTRSCGGIVIDSTARSTEEYHTDFSRGVGLRPARRSDNVRKPLVPQARETERFAC